MDQHDALVLLDRLHRAQNEYYAGGDVGPVAALLTADVHWSVAGDHVVAGEYVGLQAVLGYLDRRRRLAGCTLRLVRRDVLVGHAHHVAALTDAVVLSAGHVVTWTTVGLYAVQGGQIRRCWLLPLSTTILDDVWS